MQALIFCSAKANLCSAIRAIGHFRRGVVAEQARLGDAIAELARRTEQNDLLVDSRGIPFAVGTGSLGDSTVASWWPASRF